MNFKINSSLSLCALAFIGSLHAQPLSRMQALELAYQQHPQLQAIELNIKQKKILEQNSRFLPNPEVFGSSPDANNNYYSNIGVSQNFEHPKAYRQNKAVLEQETRVSETEKALLKYEIRQSVLPLYDAVALQNDKILFLKQQDSVLRDFLKVAEVEFRVGKISPLEKMMLETRYEDVRVQLQNAEIARHFSLQKLKTYLQITDSIYLEDRRGKWLWDRELEVEKFPMMRVFAEEEKLMIARKLQLETKYLPAFNLNYSQQIHPTQALVFPVVGAGVSLPIWKKQKNVEFQAAEIEVDKVKKQREVYAFEMERQYRLLVQELNAARQRVQTFELGTFPQSQQIWQLALKSYRLGDLTAAEYLSITQDCLLRQAQYWEALQGYNECVMRLEAFVP